MEPKQLLNEKEYREMREKYEDDFRAGMGAEAIKELLAEIDLEKLYNELMEELENASGQKRIRLLKRLEVVEAFQKSGNNPDVDDSGCGSGYSSGYPSRWCSWMAAALPPVI